MSNAPDDDLTVIRVDQFFPHPPAKVWRALAEPELLVQWQMQGARPPSTWRFSRSSRSGC